MNDLTVFQNPEFGEIRTIEENGDVLFCGTDVAKALGYINPRDAVGRRCKGVVKRDAYTNRRQTMSFIPESDLYRLVFGLEAAVRGTLRGTGDGRSPPQHPQDGAVRSPAEAHDDGRERRGAGAVAGGARAAHRADRGAGGDGADGHRPPQRGHMGGGHEGGPSRGTAARRG